MTNMIQLCHDFVGQIIYHKYSSGWIISVWIILVIGKKHLVQIGQIDKPTEFITNTYRAAI